MLGGFYQLAENMNQNDTTVVREQQITFADSEANISVEMASMDHRTITQNGMDISHFFERPINTQTYTWDDETTLFAAVVPWFDYFQSPTVRQKLRGFSRMTCEGLEVELRVNSSPFRYSSVLVSYRPLFCYTKRLKIDSEGVETYYPIPNAEFSGGHIYEDGVEDPGDQLALLANVQPSGNTLSSYMARSQRQHAYLDIASNSGAKLILPFMYPKEAIELDFGDFYNVVTNDEYLSRSYFMRAMRGMGTLHIESLAPLRNLQTADIAGCTIQMYVRPIGVRVWMASGVAAYDTQGLTSMFSSMWKSTPVDKPIVSNVQDVKLASLGDNEEFSVSSFASKRCIVAIADWSSTRMPGFGLFGMPVHPGQRVRSQVSNPASLSSRRYAMTPACFAAMNYRMWRGTARISIRAICSSFHRGRLRVVWEPNMSQYDSSIAVSESIARPRDPHTQSYIWDLSTSSQVNFTVGFGNAMSKLTVPALNAMAGATGNFTYVVGGTGGLPISDFSSDNMRDYANGILMIYVENALQAPTASTVTLVVEMSFPDLMLYDSVGQTATMDFMQSTTAGFGSNYTTGDSAEVNLYDESYAVLPNATTRTHTINAYVPQGIGTVPCMLDKDEKLDFQFQPSTYLPDFDNSSREELLDLVRRELTYDTFSFEVPVSQESGSAAVTGHKSVGMFYPPYIIKAVLPPIPGNFGTTSPCRSVSYDRDRDEGGIIGYDVTLAGNSQLICPNLARTHFAMLLKECYVAYRSTFNWRFTSLGNNGVDLEYMAVERVNSAVNTGTTYVGRIASVPSLMCLSPYGYQETVTGDPSFADLSVPSNVIVRPLSFNTGTTVVQSSSNWDYPEWMTRSGTANSGFGKNTLLQLRKRFNSLIGSFYTGGVFCHGKVNSVEARVPYFAKTRYLPSSCLAWAYADSNQELSSQLVLTLLTKSACSYVTSATFEQNTTDGWTVGMGFPKRATVNIVASVSPGSDFAVTHFVNVPNIHLLTSDPYTIESEAFPT